MGCAGPSIAPISHAPVYGHPVLLEEGSIVVVIRVAAAANMGATISSLEV
jgi:hypothetical protein